MMRPYFTLFLVLCLFSVPGLGQFSDDFNDGDLNGWEGDLAHFTINASQQLQLNAPGGSTLSWIHTPVTFADSMVWELYLKMDFAPSTSNQLKLILGATTNDLSTASGYFLEIGASGDQDALELKYLNAGVEESIASSTPALVADQPVELTLRLVKNTDGTWQCFKLGDVVPELLFSASHNSTSLSSLAVFGFQCRYTDTRRDKFFFDNVHLFAPQPDVTPPQWLDIDVPDAQTLELTFDEPLEPASAQTLLNYTLVPGNAHPGSIVHNGNLVTLTWDSPFASLQEYTLTVQDVKDEAGNAITPASKNFTFILIEKANENELLLTEIMADPTPVNGLPDAEYLELYNHSTKIIRLSDYTLKAGSSERDLPSDLLYPGTFAILCDTDNAGLFASYGQVVLIDNMPALTNSGVYLAVMDQQGQVLHELTYDLSWYNSSAKSDGGWSLEMINPEMSCSEKINWTASNHLSGGTPGDQNSQWTVLPDVSGPVFGSYYAETDQTLLLRFWEKLDGLLMSNPSAYTIQPALTVTDATLIDPMTVQLTFATPMAEGTVYRLLPFDAYDCVGNISHIGDSIEFGLIVDASPGELLIHEVLFNPASGGSRFVEILNPTGKYINLQTLVIARLTTQDQDFYPTGAAALLGPGELAVFSPSPSDIMSRYTVPHPNQLYEALLPAWDEDRDNISLLVGGEVIDSFTYSSEWHLPVIADQNGVSLERVSPSFPSTDASNWHSASSLSGYGTPTGPNSQQLLLPVDTETPFTFINRIFSPDEDGYKDYLAIRFTTGSTDDIASVWVYDLEGREIHQLISNESIGTSGLVQWDGRNVEGVLADRGMYIILVQLWNADGDVREYQASCALVK